VLEWHILLLLIVGLLILFMVSGLPLAFCFILSNLILASISWGGQAGLEQLILSTFSSLSTQALLPLPLFIIMGEVISYSGIVPQMVEAIDKWFGRLPGRLSLLAVVSGALLAAITGVSMASVAILGKVFVPEMQKRGYNKSLSIGPVMGAGGLATMIPPSVLAILVGSIGQISIGEILVAIILPGLLLAAVYASYILLRSFLQPSVAPPYGVSLPPIIDRILFTIRYVLPIGFIIFLVVGVIFFGIASPTEAAALGAVGTFILVAVYGKLNWGMVKKAMIGSAEITVMLLFIIAGAATFSQLLAFTGASQGLVNFVVNLNMKPIFILIAMQVTLLIMGTFMDPVAMLMITIPTYVPIIQTLGYNPVWFAVIILLNVEVAVISPPFGILLYTMKGVAGPGTSMGDIIRASVPFVGLILLSMALIIAFPALALWLPRMMR